MLRRALTVCAATVVAATLTAAYVVVPEAKPADADVSIEPVQPVAIAPSPTVAIVPPTTTIQPAPSTTIAPPPAQSLVDQELLVAQKRLTQLGYWNGRPDGRFGTNTSQALLAFQKVEGLTRSGRLDKTTMAALLNAERPEAPAAGNATVIDKSSQVIFVVRDGETRYVFNTSTGNDKTFRSGNRQSVAHTPVGDFSVIREVNRVDPGPLGDLYRPKYLTTDGIAIHGAPNIPAYPASHGCARVSNAVMDLIWSEDLLPVGAPVIIVD